MGQQVNKLIFIMQEMLKVFEKLLSTATDKQEQLVMMDANQLDRTVKKEVELLDQVMLLEERSGTILSEINQVFFSANSLVLGKFVESAGNGGFEDAESAEDLINVYSELKSIGTRLKEVNKKNQNLARFSQNTIKSTVKFICTESADTTRYTRSGAFEEAGAILNLVDTQM